MKNRLTEINEKHALPVMVTFGIAGVVYSLELGLVYSLQFFLLCCGV